MSGHTKVARTTGAMTTGLDYYYLVGGKRDFTEEEAKANCEHACACWNACEGINPDAIELMLEALENAAVYSDCLPQEARELVRSAMEQIYKGVE